MLGWLWLVTLSVSLTNHQLVGGHSNNSGVLRCMTPSFVGLDLGKPAVFGTIGRL